MAQKVLYYLQFYVYLHNMCHFLSLVYVSLQLPIRYLSSSSMTYIKSLLPRLAYSPEQCVSHSVGDQTL